MAQHVLSWWPGLIILDCKMNSFHLTDGDGELHVGSHPRLLTKAVDAEGGALLLAVFKDFFRQLKAQPLHQLEPCVLMLLCFCSYGRRRSEACLFFILWNWDRVGGQICAQLRRLSLGSHGRDKCGNAPCPDLS